MINEFNEEYIIGFCKICKQCKAIKNNLCIDCEKKIFKTQNFSDIFNIIKGINDDN